jgi:type VI secretion system protein VasD
VRVIELKTPGVFHSADFFGLFERDRDTLGGDFVAREEYQLKPGDRQVFQRQLQPDTRYLGVVAAYRDLERSQWRAALPVPPHQTTPLTVRLDAKGVTMRKE